MMALLSIMAFSQAKTQSKDNVPEYQISGTGETAAQGTYMVKVSVLVKKAKDVSDDVISRCAVHGVLFKGFSNQNTRQTQKPLAGSPSAEASHADYFESFFRPGGAAASYADVIGTSRTTTKSGKLYKVTTVVSVNKDQLRKDLEDAGVIKGLNSIF